ncbi:MAG: glycosyl hydrolase family 18 protein [Bacteroidota bacterium]|nr:glycosyl hydrolase family 18 protein [Bacteroidota bacterium]
MQKSFFDDGGNNIIPLKLRKTNSPAGAVFGYLPYWEYSTERNYLKYDLLTHIALFDFQADSSGNMKKPSYWPWTDVINGAHTNGVKVIMCVTNFTASQIKSLISSETNKQNFFINVKNIIKTYSLDGVNIDFEGLNKADRGSLINGFMNDLTTCIHNDFPEKEVSFAGPVINWGGWDLPGLAKACDYIFIMGYDFYGSWSTTSGPSSPLRGGTYNLSSALSSSSFGYGAVVPSYSQKLILGVPYFGNRWKVSTSSTYAKVLKHVGSIFFRTALPNAMTYGLQWDSFSQTPWCAYKQDTTWIQDWFDTDSSTAMKYELARSYNLKGVGMWALGQDGNRTELWNLLRQNVIADVKNNNSSIPENFSLSQNYPNPFNPSTIINYAIPKTSKVSLRVYDLMGRQVALLVDDIKPAGKYSATFNSTLASGVYYYTLKAGEYIQSKKMIVVK